MIFLGAAFSSFTKANPKKPTKIMQILRRSKLWQKIIDKAISPAVKTH